MIKHFSTIALLLATIATNLQADSGRWYSADVVSAGETLYKQNCASCHGPDAEAISDWKTKDSNGNYPPPPLNGSAHAWHHSIEQLKETVLRGGVPLGGVMPAFGSKLSDQDIDAVIAYFQSKWPEQIYRKWAQRFKVSDTSDEAVKTAVISEETATEPDITRFLRLRLGTDNVSPPVETPIKGVYQTRFGDKFGYLIENGRYVFIGEMFDLEAAKNLTELSRRVIVKEELDKLDDSDLSIFPAVDTEKAQLTVFTDTSCPYCKKLHEEVGYLQEAGITVRYLPYPRGGSRGPGYTELKQVWCAEDKRASMDIGKGVAEGELPAADCEAADFVDRGFEIGNRLGVNGTPSLYLESGEALTGYVPYEQLIPRILNNL